MLLGSRLSYGCVSETGGWTGASEETSHGYRHPALGQRWNQIILNVPYQHQRGFLLHRTLSYPGPSSPAPAGHEPWSYRNSEGHNWCTSLGWIMLSPHTWQHRPSLWTAPGDVAKDRMNETWCENITSNSQCWRGQRKAKNYLRKSLLTPHFSSPDIETRWNSSMCTSFSLITTSSLSTLFSLISLSVERKSEKNKQMEKKKDK